MLTSSQNELRLSILGTIFSNERYRNKIYGVEMKLTQWQKKKKKKKKEYLNEKK